jgi:spoIIIJ-associated protein
MSKSVITEGKTTNEAIEKGLKELKTSKENVEIKVLENDEKRSFFSILAPRVVKVELTLKEEIENPEKEQKEVKEIRNNPITEEEKEHAKEGLTQFLEHFIKVTPQGTTYSIELKDNDLFVKIEGEDIGYLIGYRGETLYAIQTILSSIANKNIKGRVRVILDIAGYKEKRVKTLENLADKVAKTVERTQKSVTLEPMKAYERKIIHARLQNSKKVTTNSIGEEPRRKVVISIKK